MRQARPIERIHRAADERLQPSRVAERQVSHEGDADRPRSRFHPDSRREPCLDGVSCFLRLLEHRREIGVSADARKVHALAIHRDFDLVGIVHAADVAEVGRLEVDLERVLGVEREHAAHQHAPDGPERQPFDVLVLRQVLANPVGVADGTDPRIAHRERADLSRRRQIALLQRRRDTQHVGNIVETVRRIVRGKERGHIDLEGQEIADRVGVFRAVQPMKHRPPRIGLQRPSSIQFALERRH